MDRPRKVIRDVAYKEDSGVTVSDIKFDVYSTTHPSSIYNMMHSKTFKKAMLAVPEKYRLRDAGQTISMTVGDDHHLVKKQFWDEYSTAQVENRKMVMANIYVPYMTSQRFEFCFLKDQSRKLAWLLNAPAGTKLMMHVLLNKAQSRLSEILDLSPIKKITHPDGTVEETLNAQHANLTVSVFKYLKDRIDPRVNKNVNLSITKRETTNSKVDPGDMSLSDIEAKLEQTRQQIRLSKKNVPKMIDVTPSKKEEEINPEDF